MSLTTTRLTLSGRVDLREHYNAPLNGMSNPLSNLGFEVARDLYPDAGITTANIATYEQDTAAWFQAEADLRSRWGGIIGLPDGAAMMVSRTLELQDASLVNFHGRPGTILYTNGCGTAPAIRAARGGLCTVLRDLTLCAKPRFVSVRTDQRGAAHTGFQPGAVAFQIENCQGSEFKGMVWNGYDQPFLWGDNTWGITFSRFVGSGNNQGLNWFQSKGLNSMERMRFVDGTLCNNNLGLSWDATYPGGAQGGSIFLDGCSLDYNVVRHINYIGSLANNPNTSNSLHVTNCHIETSGACSGTALCRGFTQGAALFSNCELYESDGASPIGLIEVAEDMTASMMLCRLNTYTSAMFWGNSAGFRRVSGFGNICQGSYTQPILLIDGNGSHPQP